MRAPLATALPALALAALAACSSVPGTGRSQLMLLSQSQEKQLGEEAYVDMLSQVEIVRTGPDAEMVARIGDRIAAAAADLYPDSAAADFDWEFTLIKDDGMVNAWALPGGKCAVYTGLLPVTGDEDSLAAVMGHEVSHAIARHGGERMSQQVALSVALAGAAYGTKDMDTEERVAIMGALGLGAQFGVILPFSRDHELEADELGLLLAAHAGYDPRAAVGLWQRMAAASGGGPPEWLSTHPAEETRIKQLRKLMPRAMELYEAAQAAGR